MIRRPSLRNISSSVDGVFGVARVKGNVACTRKKYKISLNFTYLVIPFSFHTISHIGMICTLWSSINMRGSSLESCKRTNYILFYILKLFMIWRERSLKNASLNSIDDLRNGFLLAILT